MGTFATTVWYDSDIRKCISSIWEHGGNIIELRMVRGCYLIIYTAPSKLYGFNKEME